MTIRLSLSLMTASVALALSGCSKSDEGAAGSGPGAKPGSVAAVAAPAGTKWSDKVEATAEGGFRMGNPAAPLKLIEYGSYTCPHCADLSEQAHDPLKAGFIDSGKVSFEYRNYVRDPLDVTAAMVARCNGAATFFPLTEQMFANQKAMFAQFQSQSEAEQQAAVTAPPGERFMRYAQLAGLVDFAKQRGLPEPKLRACLADTATADRLVKMNEEGNALYAITGTPTLILNGQVLQETGTWSALQARLRDAGA
jgi:protein-disulfide isomerase